MSYDYMLVKRISGADFDFEAFAESAVSESIGSIESVQAAISKIFPSVQWANAGFFESDSVFTVGSVNGEPEFFLSVEPDGQVHMITMSRAERSEVELAARELGLTVLDEQSMEMFGG
jgi:hypothetical protein